MVLHRGLMCLVHQSPPAATPIRRGQLELFCHKLSLCGVFVPEDSRQACPWSDFSLPLFFWIDSFQSLDINLVSDLTVLLSSVTWIMNNVPSMSCFSWSVSSTSIYSYIQICQYLHSNFRVRRYPFTILFIFVYVIPTHVIPPLSKFLIFLISISKSSPVIFLLLDTSMWWGGRVL